MSILGSPLSSSPQSQPHQDSNSNTNSSSSILIILEEKTLIDCGGNAFDTSIAEYLEDEFSKTHENINIMNNFTAKSRVFDAAESAKIELSNSMTTTVNIPFLTADHTGPKHLVCDISRVQLENILSKHISTIENSLEELLTLHKGVCAVLLVGGGARMVLMKNRLQKILKDTELIVLPQPEEINAIGASYMRKF